MIDGVPLLAIIVLNLAVKKISEGEKCWFVQPKKHLIGFFQILCKCLLQLKPIRIYATFGFSGSD